MSKPWPKTVQSTNYHLWTDALHARELAKQASDRWNRGAYVRWAVITAWTVLEMACEDALQISGIGRNFKVNLENALNRSQLAPLDWSIGLWKSISDIHGDRKDYIHRDPPQAKLFPDASKAEEATRVIRDAMADIYQRCGKPPPKWITDDYDPGWVRKDQTRANLTAVHTGADPDDPAVVRIAFVIGKKE